jgi:glycerophosphoryl diester phosphodiesterase
VHTIYLTNFYHYNELPPLSECFTMGDGLNVQYTHVTRQLVEAMHAHNKLVFVWIDAEQTQECAKVFCEMYELGIDGYCTDYPLEVQTIFERCHQLLTSETESKQTIL